MTSPPVDASIEAPVIPPRLHRPLAAVWVSLALHGAIIALIQVAPPASPVAGYAIEARLVDVQPAPLALQPAEPLAEAEPLTPAPTTEPHTPAAVLPTPPVEPRPAEPAAAEPAPAGALSTAVDLTYYSARELDVQPRALRAITPEYPADADRQRLSGTVRLQLKLEADGRVADASVVEASPPGVFDESALRAFRAAHFAPARKDGRPVRAQILIEVSYDIEPPAHP
ncbi:MAG: TonB family protein [Gammaproteobacteria bacterium]